MKWFQKVVQNIKKPLGNSGSGDKVTLSIPELRDWLLVQYHLRRKQSGLNEAVAVYLEQVSAKAETFAYNLELWEERLAGNSQEREAGSLLGHARQVVSWYAKQKEEELWKDYSLSNSPSDSSLNSSSNSSLNSLPKRLVTYLTTIQQERELSPEMTALCSSVVQEVQGMHQLQTEIQEKIAASGLVVFGKLQEARKIMEEAADKQQAAQRRKAELELRLQQNQQREQQKAVELQALKSHPDYQLVVARQQALASKEASRALSESQVPRRTPFQMKVDEAEYKLAHFSQQRQRLEEECLGLQEQIDQYQNACQRAAAYFSDIAKVSLGRGVTIPLEMASSVVEGVQEQ